MTCQVPKKPCRLTINYNSNVLKLTDYILNKIKDKSRKDNLRKDNPRKKDELNYEVWPKQTLLLHNKRCTTSQS
jgi:hypothetical protein